MSDATRHLLVLFVVLGSGIQLAHGYHLAGDFEETAAKGGAGDLWFTGSPRWLRYDCSACHTDPPGNIDIKVTTTPAELLTLSTYRAGQTYDIEIELLGEHAGLTARSNINLIGLEFVDASGNPAGRFDYEEMVMLEPVPDLGVLFSQPVQDQRSWTFQWTAPLASQGTVFLYVAAVDGDGNGVGVDAPSSAPGSDPRGDDVATLTIGLRAHRLSLSSTLPAPTDEGCAVATSNQGSFVLLLLLLVAYRSSLKCRKY